MEKSQLDSRSIGRRSIRKTQYVVFILLYYVVAYEHLEHPTLILFMLYEGMCCIHYAFDINVNELECNGYFSTV